MSVNFDDLLNNTFDNGTIHIKYLEQIMRSLLKKLNLQNDEIDNDKVNDPVPKMIDDENQMTSIINHVNLTKRIEALEISVHKISSVMHTWMMRRHGKEVEVEQDIEIKQESFIDVEQKPSSIISIAAEDSIPLLKPQPSVIKPASTVEKTFKQTSSDENMKNFDDQAISDLQEHMCKLEMKIGSYDDKFKDLFYACGEHEEKIDEIFLSLDDFKANIACLKSNVRRLLDEEEQINKKILELSNVCQNLELSKADQAYVDDVMVVELANVSSKVKDLNENLDKISQENGILYVEMQKFDESFQRFKKTITECLSFFNAQVSDKLDKKELSNVKKTLANQFCNFITELKTFLISNSRSSAGIGTSKILDNLKCMSCENYPITMNAVINDGSNLKKEPPKAEIPSKSNEQMFSCTSKESLINFPTPSQQCFIVSRDNTIFKADPLKCLLNPNYTKF